MQAATVRSWDRPGVVGVVGAGLIGGSVLRRCQDVGVPAVAFDHDPAVRSTVARSGIAVVDDLGALVDEVDVTVLAVPPKQVFGLWRDVAHRAEDRRRPTRLVAVDVASVKAPILDDLSLDGGPPTRTEYAELVVTHPMAGRADTGWRSALPDLFVDAAWLVCPTSTVDVDSLARVVALARVMGSRACFMALQDHDRFAAYVSHLPHVVAFAYQRVLDAADPSGAWEVFGAGSRADLLRVADAEPRLWEEILTENADALDGAIRAFVAAMQDPAIVTEQGRRRPPRPPSADDVEVVLPGTGAIGHDALRELERAGAVGMQLAGVDDSGDSVGLQLRRGSPRSSGEHAPQRMP